MDFNLPVAFSLLVNGKRMGAYLGAILDAGTYNVFSISFADGYHDCFFDQGNGIIRAINEVKGKPYAAALKHDLHVFDHLRDDVTLENFPYEVDGQFANGWIFTKKQATGLIYTIYLKGIYQFDIEERESGWAAFSEKVEGRGEIDQKLANYAFKWATTPAPTPRQFSTDEGVHQQAAQIKVDKPVEFLFDFQFKGAPMIAFGLLQDRQPWKQCTVGVKSVNAQSEPEFYEFYKVDNKDQLFSWIPEKGMKEKMAKAIAGELEKRFAVHNQFAAN